MASWPICLFSASEKFSDCLRLLPLIVLLYFFTHLQCEGEDVRGGGDVSSHQLCGTGDRSGRAEVKRETSVGWYGNFSSCSLHPFTVRINTVYTPKLQKTWWTEIVSAEVPGLNLAAGRGLSVGWFLFFPVWVSCRCSGFLPQKRIRPAGYSKLLIGVNVSVCLSQC